MGKYNNFKPQVERKKKEVHPVWRGIGLILMILGPILAYFSTIVLLDENAKNGWVAIPTEIIAPGADPLLYTKIILTVFFLLVFYAILMLFTFTINRLFGPSRYSDYDVPSTSYHGKRYKR
jgi:hypothetical protein